MTKLMLALLLTVVTGGHAEGMEIPLAVTGVAHPSLKVTPTGDQLLRSDDYLKSGLEMLKRQNYARAIADFQDSVRQAPRAENYKALGTAYYEAGKPLKASWAYRESLQLRSDPQVQALVDSIEGKDHPEERFRDKYDETRYASLLKSAAQAEKQGRPESALRDYADAIAIHNAPEARRPLGRLAAGLAEDYMRAKAPAKAIDVLIKARDAYAKAKDLSKDELAFLARFDKTEREVADLTGKKLRENQKAMLTDRESWERELAERLAKKVNSVNLEMKGERR